VVRRAYCVRGSNSGELKAGKNWEKKSKKGKKRTGIEEKSGKRLKKRRKSEKKTQKNVQNHTPDSKPLPMLK